MSRYMHMYKNLDRDTNLTVEVPMRQLVEKVDHLNYGVHRFLSHLVDVRREGLAADIKKYEDRGDFDVAEHVRREGDRLADGIEQLLALGLF